MVDKENKEKRNEKNEVRYCTEKHNTTEVNLNKHRKGVGL